MDAKTVAFWQVAWPAVTAKIQGNRHVREECVFSPHVPAVAYRAIHSPSPAGQVEARHAFALCVPVAGRGRLCAKAPSPGRYESRAPSFGLAGRPATGVLVVGRGVLSILHAFRFQWPCNGAARARCHPSVAAGYAFRLRVLPRNLRPKRRNAHGAGSRAPWAERAVAWAVVPPSRYAA